MPENALWEDALEHSEWLDSARENVELMKARFNDLMLDEQEAEELAGIQNEIHILVIGTDRCNDTAGNLPVLARMASLSSLVHLRILDSDENARVHQNYRVNGKRKTPVVLFLNQNNEELCRWIERPNAAYRTLGEQASSIDDRRDFLKRLYSDPEILRQSLGELMPLLLRADYLLQV
ncbi:MAG: thioredoxin family protein [Promethearchaeia archaeon]